MNLRGVGEFAPVFATGAVSLSKCFGNVEWYKFDKFLKTKESKDDLATFRYFVSDVYSSVILSVIGENEVDNDFFSDEEQNLLQDYYFSAYLQTCDFIQHDSNVDQIIRDGVLDLQNFYALSESDVRRRLFLHISGLQKLDSIHKFYAYRKILAKCDVIKWNSDFDEIFEKLKSENTWPELPDYSLTICLQQHFELLRGLKNGGNIMGSVSNSNTPECSGSNLLAAINKEYSEKLDNLNNECEETRMRQYLEHIEFKNLVTKRVDEAQQFRTISVAQRVGIGAMVRLFHCDLEVASSNCRNSLSAHRGKVAYI